MKRRANSVIVRNIILEDFINMLIEVYESGVDVVDMEIEKKHNQDVIYIVDVENPINEEQKEIPISSIDLNDLI